MGTGVDSGTISPVACSRANVSNFDLYLFSGFRASDEDDESFNARHSFSTLRAINDSNFVLFTSFYRLSSRL